MSEPKPASSWPAGVGFVGLILLGIALLPTLPIWIAICGVGWLVSMILGVPIGTLISKKTPQ